MESIQFKRARGGAMGFPPEVDLSVFCHCACKISHQGLFENFVTGDASDTKCQAVHYRIRISVLLALTQAVYL
jgi:hypothetical protein